ncbi:hypothetical protein [Piscinibacter sp.]|uniref:hypothetical protein n=1 Tax=Piscinibacter sp. TaxID=1903157 RepID=UPI0039E512FA
MAYPLHRATLAAFVAAALAAPAWADSTSSASSAASQSVGSISGSIEHSSNSSSGDRNVAEGEYRIIEVAEVAGQPGTQRLTLQAVQPAGAAGADEFFLYVPQPVVEQGKLAPGGLVMARHKPYGLEFAHAKTLKGFFMALKDEWYRELQTRPVSL